MFALAGVFALSSCEDVPAPYPIPNGGGNNTPTTSTFYSSTSCSDFTTLAAASGNDPWSQGGSYTQATGYQKWDGADAKSNRMADGYLISPAFGTVTDSTDAYISFQYCVAYANNDAQFADHIKLYASSQYDPAEGFVAEKWTQLDWKATHTSTNWELATTTVALPAEFLNKENVNIAFYFTTPNDTKSATFEVKDLKVVAGTPAENGGDTPTPAGTEVTCAEAVTLTNALADGATSTEVYSVTGYITQVVGSVSNNQQTFWMADSKDGGKVFEAYYANLPEGVSEFKAGAKVKITGKLTKYVKDGKVTAEIKNAEVEILEAGGDTPDPQPTGTEITCAKAVELTNALTDGGTSEEVYSITGYITEVVGSVSTKTGTPQQTFWMADTKDGGKVFEAYYANVPEGISEFKAGAKVKITGKLTKYVKDGKVTPEIKNATVEILEDGDGGNGGDGGDTPEVSGNSITFSAQGYENAQDFNDKSITVGDATLTFSKGSGSTTPKYYNTGTGMRLYGGNTLTISSSKTISKVAFTFDKGEDQNNRPFYATSSNTSFTPGTFDYEAQTWSGSATEVVASYTGNGGHIRIQSITITYAE